MRETARFFKVLADEARLKMLWLLFHNRELCVCDIMAVLEITQSKASRHLAALRNAGLTQSDIDWYELNEAFAAQSLAVINSLGLDPAKVNPMGGAIALGHPLGATGAIRSATVVHALRRKNLKYGMVTMCVGMGQGAAGIFERV